MGGWEANTIPANVPLDFGRPEGFFILAFIGPELYTPNFDRFEQHLLAAAKRVPLLGESRIKTLINGPIPVGADGEPIMGRVPDISNAYVGSGFTAGTRLY